MKAVIITRAGGPDVLEVQERPAPTPSPSEVLVRVRATALNRADMLQREGRYPAPPGAPADIPGMEFSGEIVSVGADAQSWKTGDRVFGIVPGGSYAECLVADAQSVARVPEHLSWEEAAAIPEAFITAHDALVTQAQVQPNEHVLIHAVGSGVGLAAVQLARAWKAVPYGTARNEDKIARARALGLEDGIAISDGPDAMLSHVERWTNGKGMQVILDLLGGPYVASSIKASALRARLMLIGTIAGRNATVPLGELLAKRITMRGTVLRSRSVEEKRAATAAFECEVVPLLASGAVKATIDSSFALDQVRLAHDRMESNQTFGKIILKV